jgi:HD-GYP domain-containing protein (c-di-GMP phosphodiesterase class II)
MHAHLLSNTLQQPLEWMVLGLASELARACTDDADAFLAALHLDRQSPYLVVQQLLGATLVELSARVLGLDEGARLTLCCAALTRDLALLPMQAQLDKQTTGLSAEQQAQVRAHPERTVAWLQQLGVTDPRWLRLVRQHHERSDGSGYPQALAGVSIPEGARLIALADSYAAMVTPRQNRGGQYPHTALKSLFLDGERLYNATLASSLVKILSMTPPGSLVRLANGELAVVRSRPSADGQNDIWSLYGRDGMPFLLALRRNTDNPDHKIIGYVRVEDCRSAAPVLNRLWLNSIERSKA